MELTGPFTQREYDVRFEWGEPGFRVADLQTAIRECASGRELVRGFEQDVRLALGPAANRGGDDLVHA